MTDTVPVPRILHPLLDLPNIQHGFFTRHGGVSNGIYDSLNVGRGSGDAPEAVEENRRRVAAAFGQPAEHLLSLYQIHSPTVHTPDAPFDSLRPEGDGIVTATPGLIVSALSADCAPLLFADPVAGVVGACHAGWKGALYGIIESTIAALIQKGATIENLRCVIGPCIAQASYEVSEDYRDTFAAEDPQSPAFFVPGAAPGKYRFDLPGYCLMRLKRAGVNQCAATGHDTCAEENLFFSNRRAFHRNEGDYGRLISGIMIRGT